MHEVFFLVPVFMPALLIVLMGSIFMSERLFEVKGLRVILIRILLVGVVLDTLVLLFAFNAGTAYGEVIVMAAWQLASFVVARILLAAMFGIREFFSPVHPPDLPVLRKGAPSGRFFVCLAPGLSLQYHSGILVP